MTARLADQTFMTNDFLNSSHDLLIVGAGGAGLSAAIRAKEQGLSVLVLEKAEHLGGTTAWSVGSFTASQTPHQKRLNIHDHPDLHFEDMSLFNAGKGEVDNLKLRALLVNHASETLEWLMELGVVFDGPYPESHHRYPRMHNVIPNSNSFVHHLLKRAQQLKIPILTQCQVTSLISKDARVTGLKIDYCHEEHSLYATKGVLLCAGDFAASTHMKQKFLGPLVAKAASVNPQAKGEGIQMAQALGAKVLNGGHASALKMRFVAAPPHFIQNLPPYAWLAKSMVWSLKHLPSWLIRPVVMKFITTVLGPEPTLFECGALLIDDQGQMIKTHGQSHAQCVIETQNNQAYIVFNEATAQQLNTWPHFISTAPGVAYAYLKDYVKARGDICKVAENLHDLACTLELPAQAFVLSTQSLMPSKRFYAMGPVRGFVTITEGGLAINEQFQVLDMNDQPIAGLFAAGSNGQGGLLLEGHGHHIAWAFVSGRLAGQSVAKFQIKDSVL